MDKKTTLGIVSVVLIAGFVGLYIWSTNRPSQKVYHVGVLSALEYFSPVIDGFKQEMTRLGYIEGENIFYDVQKGPTPVGNKQVVDKFVTDHVDLVLVFPTEASLEAKEATRGSKIPVLSIAASLEESGLVENMLNPGGNVTGVRFPITEVATQRLEILHELAPNAKRVLVPYLKDYPTVASALKALGPMATSLGLTLVEAPFSTPLEVSTYLSEREKNPQIDAILTIPEPLSIVPPFIDQFYVFADAHNIPTVGAAILDTDHGPIAGFIPNSFEMGRLAAPLANKIFNGISPGEIPIVTPESYLEINYRVIQKLKLVASEKLLVTAKRIFR